MYFNIGHLCVSTTTTTTRLFLLRLILPHWAAETTQCPMRLCSLMPARQLFYPQYLRPPQCWTPTVPIIHAKSIIIIIIISILSTTIIITPRLTPNNRVGEVTMQLKFQVLVVTITTTSTNITRTFTSIISFSSSSSLVSFAVFYCWAECFIIADLNVSSAVMGLRLFTVSVFSPFSLSGGKTKPLNRSCSALSH